MGSRYQLCKHMLMQCAEAVKAENLNAADSLLREIKSLISSETDGGVRKLVNCYAEALVRRVYGIHPPYHLPVLPSEALFDLDDYFFLPFGEFAHVATKTAIKDAFVPGHNRVHVIDFSMLGLDPEAWDWFMEELACRELGASFRLTMILPKHSLPFGDILQQLRKRITEYAEYRQIDFELRVLVVNYTRADDIVKCCLSKLRRTCQEEMLVVRWSFSLHKLLSKEGAIDSVLLKMKVLKPDIMVIVEQEANHNGPDFLNRFAQSFQYYSSVFESLDKDCFIGYPRKDLWETYFRRQIENVVSCEDFDRIERHESVALWQQRLFQAGFIPVFFQSDDFGISFDKYEIQKKDGHALLCRDNCPLAVTSVWKHQELTHFNPGLDIVAQDVSELPLNEEFEMASSSDSDDDHVDDPTTKTGRNIWFIRGFSMIRIAASAKLFDMSEYMCHKYELPIALAWISSGRGDNLNSRGKRILRIVETACYGLDGYDIRFMRASIKGHLEEGQGVAGKAIHSDGCFVPNISVFDAIDYPFADNTKNYGLHAAVAIKLSSTDTCNDDYMLEFFLPMNMKGSSEQKTLIDRLLCALQKKCGNLWSVRFRELNEANIPEAGIEDARTSNILPAAVCSSSVQPLPEGIPNLNGIVKFGEFSLTTDGVETQEPFDQCPTGWISFKLNDWNPAEFPRRLRHQIFQWLASMPVELEGYIRMYAKVGRVQNAIAAPVANDDNELVSVDSLRQAISTNKRQKVSSVWEGFSRHVENGEVWATCKYCNKQYRAESTRGTSNFHKHLKKCLASGQEGAEQQSLPLVEISDSRTGVVQRSLVLNQERSRLDIARMIIKHGYPLDMIRHEFFKIFLKNLQPMFELYSQDNAEADVLVVYKQEKESLKKYVDNLSCRFSLTICLQSSEEKKLVYCCLTLLFIDDGWELKKKILAFRNLECKNDVGTLYEVTTDVLTEWKINKNVHFISVDVGPSNDHMVGELTSKLSVQIPLLNWDLCYLPRYAQILDLLVRDLFYEIQSVLCKIRESIEYVNGTPHRRQKFQEAIDQVKLQDNKMASLDVPSRWDTTFLMLESAVGFRKAFTFLELVGDDFKANLSMEEWDMAAIICEWLKVFHKCMCNSPENIEVYFLNVCYVYKHLRQWEKSEHVHARSMAERMKIKFDNYRDSCRLALETLVVLNPRFKLDLVKYGYGQIYGSDASSHLLRLRQHLADLYCKYVNDSINLAPSTSTITDARWISYSPDCADKFSGFNEWRKRNYERNMADSQITELNQYLEQPPANLDERSNILDWWRANAPNFPTLAKMARDFLAIPVSTIISKSSFAENVTKMKPAFNDVRPEIVEALVCGKDWIESPERT